MIFWGKRKVPLLFFKSYHPLCGSLGGIEGMWETSKRCGRMDVLEGLFKSECICISTCLPAITVFDLGPHGCSVWLWVLLMILFPAHPLGAPFSVSDEDSLHIWLSSISHDCPESFGFQACFLAGLLHHYIKDTIWYHMCYRCCWWKC